LFKGQTSTAHGRGGLVTLSRQSNQRRTRVIRNASSRTGLFAQSGKTTGCSILSPLIVRAWPTLQKVLLCPSLHTTQHRFT